VGGSSRYTEVCPLGEHGGGWWVVGIQRHILKDEHGRSDGLAAQRPREYILNFKHLHISSR
jgi:hypothetical protein